MEIQSVRDYMAAAGYPSTGITGELAWTRPTPPHRNIVLNRPTLERGGVCDCVIGHFLKFSFARASTKT